VFDIYAHKIKHHNWLVEFGANTSTCNIIHYMFTQNAIINRNHLIT